MQQNKLIKFSSKSRRFMQILLARVVCWNSKSNDDSEMIDSIVYYDFDR